MRLSPLRLLFLALALVAGHGLGALGQGDPQKSPVPDKTAQDKAEIVILSLFKDKFQKAKTDPAVAVGLAAVLLREGLEINDDKPLRFVALSHARDLASQAGDVTLAFLAITELSKDYAVDPLAMKTRVLAGAAVKVTSPQAAEVLIQAAFACLEEMLATDNFKLATVVIAAAEVAVLKVKEDRLPLAARIKKRASEVEATHKEYNRIQLFQAKLDKNRDDREANLELGRYLCVVKGDFRRGLPMLAKSQDGPMKDLAVKDLANPTEPKQQVAVGDGWDKLAEEQKLLPQRNLLRRAHFWYGKALPQLAGLSKVRIQRRFEELDKQFAVEVVKVKVAMVAFSNSIGMKLVPIPAGKFLMGAPQGEPGAQGHEMPQHEVEITKPFFMGAYEVTQAQYEKVMGNNPSQSKGMMGLDTSDFPVEKVSWESARDFCERLSKLPAEKQAGRVYRLPTEAEWEYACRAGGKAPYSTGNILTPRDANITGQGGVGRVTKVGSYRPNAWGLYDMHGNVWEWCSDWYDATYYARSPKQDPQGPDNGTNKVHHGSSFLSSAIEARASHRISNQPNSSFHDAGFRVVCVIGKTP